MVTLRAALVVLLLARAAAWAASDLPLGLHYSPTENLEVLELRAIAQAREAIDLAMYGFTDEPLARALRAAAERGVVIRLYRDHIQLRGRGDQTGFLLGHPNIHVRVKHNESRNIMHLKAYVIDHRILRTGSANWSAHGEGAACSRGRCSPRQQQDNDLLFTTDPELVAAFERAFETLWARPDNSDLPSTAITSPQ